jgi:hypothetical protein
MGKISYLIELVFLIDYYLYFKSAFLSILCICSKCQLSVELDLSLA